ncbi:hypothetical protein [Holdemanella sp.]|uniref:hypothetical protein n=1 Tax=Holdemanella sp. TaxID=1971762 RepID=UPI00307AA0BB
MATKEEYQEALNRMEEAYYNFDNCISSMNKFKEDINLLTGLVNEHFGEKKESNLEHYKEEIKSAGYDFALVNGKPTTCKWILCDQCFFKDRILCSKKRIEWMLKPFKRKYKLTQFEYDLLQSYASGYKFKDIMPLIVMKEKGYFKDINKDEKITDILWNCGVIKND